MRLIQLFLRVLAIGGLVFWTFFVYLGRRLAAGVISKEKRELLRGDVLANLLQSLGATYIKFGQILSTRPDLFGPGITESLARLQDQVTPVPYAEIEEVMHEELGGEPAGVRSFNKEPLAAASVAQVHRATLLDGSEVVFKVQRKRAKALVERDLILMGWGARLLNTIPSLKLLSMPGSVDRFAEAMRNQLDFRLEAKNNHRFAKNFENTEGVRVPELHEQFCTERVLCMEYIAGVRANEVEQVGGDRKAIARHGLNAILQMVFADGFVHADLHPGNIVLTDDGEVVLIDLGLVAEIDDDFRGPWIQTFIALTQQDGALAAKLFYGYAPTVGPEIDYAAFEAEVQSRFDVLKGKPMHELEASKVLMGMMNVLRKYKIQIDPVFTVVNLAMLVAEGLGKQLDPDLDLIALAAPYLMKAIAEAPTAMTPRRQPPTLPKHSE